MRRIALLMTVILLACGEEPSEPGGELSGKWSYNATASNEEVSCEATGYLLTIADGRATLEGGTVSCNDEVCGDAWSGSGPIIVDGSDVTWTTDLLAHEGSRSGSTMSGSISVDHFEWECERFSITILEDGSGTWEARR